MIEYPIIYVCGLIVAMILDICACSSRGWAVCGFFTTHWTSEDMEEFKKQRPSSGVYVWGRITDLDFFAVGRAVIALVIISILLLATCVILELLMQFVPAVGKNNYTLKIISLVCCGLTVLSMVIVMSIYGDKVYASGFSMWLFAMAFVLSVESLAIGLISFFG